MFMRTLACFSLLLFTFSSHAAPGSPVGGTWHAALIPAQGYEVRFQIRIAEKAGSLKAELANGESVSSFTRAFWDGKFLTLELDHVDGKISAELIGGVLEGTYTRVTSSGTASYTFRASQKAPEAAKVKAPGKSVEGSWAVTLDDGKSPRKVMGIFRQKGTAVAGTFASQTGDYGPLNGTFDGEVLLLSVFDGVFVYRVDASLGKDGALSGEFRAGKAAPLKLSAEKLTAEAAKSFLPMGAGETKVKDSSRPLSLSLPDADGKTVSLSDPRFANKAVIVTIMGTWCPNCHDEAPVLQAFKKKYGARGLEVIAVAYEYTNDGERNRRQVKRFAERHGIDYPILIAGTTKEAAASPLIAQMEGWKGYPTTLYLDRKHKTVKIHSGFDGPATGERFQELEAEMTKTIESLLGR